jgi:hypothetical protein
VGRARPPAGEPLICALLLSAGVAFALGDVADGAAGLGVVVLNALIGFVQEYRAGRAIQALARLVSEPARVRRDGQWTQTAAEHLVPGDVVAVESGVRVAADLRVPQARGLRADESALILPGRDVFIRLRRGVHQYVHVPRAAAGPRPPVSETGVAPDVPGVRTDRFSVITAAHAHSLRR